MPGEGHAQESMTWTKNTGNCLYGCSSSAQCSHFLRSLQSWVPKDKVGKRPISFYYFVLLRRKGFGIFAKDRLGYALVENSYVSPFTCSLCSCIVFAFVAGCPHLGLCSLSMSKRWHTHDIKSHVFSLLSMILAPLLHWSRSLVCCRLWCCSVHIDIVLTNNTHCTSSLRAPALVFFFHRDMCRHTHFMGTFWHFRFLFTGPGIFFACLVICLFVFQ